MILEKNSEQKNYINSIRRYNKIL